MAFESAQNFAKKRAQILFDVGAPAVKNSAGVQYVRCATRAASAKPAADSVLHFVPRFCDLASESAQNFAKKRANVR